MEKEKGNKEGSSKIQKDDQKETAKSVNEGEKTKEIATLNINKRPHIAKSKEPLNLIVVADSDMLSNAFWVQVRQFFGRRFTTPIANNGDFVLNSVENLSGNSDLIGLRSRGSARRPFTKLEKMRKSAQEKFKAEEQKLLRELEETEKKLVELQGLPNQGHDGEKQKTLSEEQKAEIEKFTSELLVTRKALRQVRHNLRKDIDVLRNRLSAINIALVPILIIVGALGFGVLRIKKRKRALEVEA